MRWGVAVFFVVVILVVALPLVEDVLGVVRTVVSSVVSTYTVTVTSVEASTVTSVSPVTVTRTVREVVYGGGSAGSSVSVVTVTRPFTVTVTSTITTVVPGARGSDGGLLFLLAEKPRGVVVGGLEAGGARLYSTSDGFIVVSYSGGLDSRPLFWVEGRGGCRVYFVTWIPGGLGQVGVSWLYTDGSYGVEAYSVGDLAGVVERLGCGDELYVVFVDRMCRLSIDGGVAVIDGCERVNVLSSQEGYRGKSLLEALADYVNSTSISYVYHTVFDAGRVESVLWGAWRLLGWVDENVVYDSSKPIHVGVYDPIEFARRGSGVCSDYSVFIAAGLVGISGEALVFAMNTSTVPHAAPGLAYDGALLVLDQHLPIVEFQDYVEYIANLTSSWVYVYHVVFDADKNASRIVLSRVPVELLLSIYQDTWPRDNIDDELLVRELGAELAGRLGASFTGARECSSDRPGFALTLSGKVFHLYTPILRGQWAAWLAERIIETLKSSMGHTGFSEVCIEILDEGYGVRVYFYK